MLRICNKDHTALEPIVPVSWPQTVAHLQGTGTDVAGRQDDLIDGEDSCPPIQELSLVAPGADATDIFRM